MHFLNLPLIILGLSFSRRVSPNDHVFVHPGKATYILCQIFCAYALTANMRARRKYFRLDYKKVYGVRNMPKCTIGHKKTTTTNFLRFSFVLRWEIERKRPWACQSAQQGGPQVSQRAVCLVRMDGHYITYNKRWSSNQQLKTDRVGANIFVLEKLLAAFSLASAPIAFSNKGRSVCSSLSLCGLRWSMMSFRIAKCSAVPGESVSSFESNSLTC